MVSNRREAYNECFCEGDEPFQFLEWTVTPEPSAASTCLRHGFLSAFWPTYSQLENLSDSGNDKNCLGSICKLRFGWEWKTTKSAPHMVGTGHFPATWLVRPQLSGMTCCSPLVTKTGEHCGPDCMADAAK